MLLGIRSILIYKSRDFRRLRDRPKKVQKVSQIGILSHFGIFSHFETFDSETGV